MLIFLLLFIAEIFLFCCAGMIFTYHSERTIAESLSLGIFLTLILISLIFQVAFLLEVPNLAFVAEIILSLLTIRYIIRHWVVFKQASNKIKNFILKHKIISGIVIACWLYLFFLVAIIPPSNWDSMAYNLSRVFLFEQEKSLFLENVNTVRQSMFVVGADLLNHGFLRLDRDYGVGIFSWLAYISIGLGTYGLSRSFASPQISVATTLIIISLPQFCFQATSTKNDIFTAASAVFCFLVGDRLLAQPNAKNLALMLLGLAYGFSTKTTFVAFLGPFGLGFAAIAFWQIGWRKLYQIVTQNWRYLLVLTAPILIISQSWLFLHNALKTQDVTGGGTIKIVTESGNLGGIANLVRYFLQSIHLFPLDYLVKGRLGFDFGEQITNFYNRVFYPVFGNISMAFVNDDALTFRIKTLPHEDFSWYGPLALVIIIPAILWSLLKGNYWLKVQSLSLLGFILIFSFKLIWTPWSNRYVVLFFAASGACIAFFLQQISKKYQPKILSGITAIALILLISASTLNVTKPLGGLSITQFFQPNIWTKTAWGSDRLYYARRHHGDDRVEQFRNLVPPRAKVALLAGDKSWIYHFYLVNPQGTIVPTIWSTLQNQPSEYDYLLCLDVECNFQELPTFERVLWQSSDKAVRPSALIQLKKNQ
jgi:hypothetical protein